MDAKDGHKISLRVVANAVHDLVRKPANMVRFRSQVKIFCEKNEANEKEFEQLKKASEANAKLQAAIKRMEKQKWGKTWDEMTSAEREEAIPDPDDIMKSPPEGYENYVWYKGFCVPPPQNPDIFTYLTPPPGLYYHGPNFYENWALSKPLNDDDRIMSSYALLTAIHDMKIFERRIFTDQVYRGSWGLRDNWIVELWRKCQYQKTPDEYEDNKDIEEWIERALADVRADLARIEPAETEQNTSPGKWWRIWACIKIIPSWIYFLAALLTCIYFLWWLWTKFSP